MQEYFYEIDLALKDHGIGEVGSYGISGVEVFVPNEIPNGNKGYWTPEHLLGASVSTCFMENFIKLLSKNDIKVVSYQSQAFIKLEKKNKNFVLSEILLRPIVKLRTELEMNRVMALSEQTEDICPIINSLKIKIDIHPQFHFVKASEKSTI